jgi:predicted DNA-binding transcriptional regulator
MLFPALAEASRDRALKGTPHTVYLWLTCNLLDVEEYRAVKLVGLATAIGLDEDTASRALRVLVDRGYLAREHRGTVGYVYRLYLSRRAA